MRHFLISVATVLALGWPMQALADKHVTQAEALAEAERVTADLLHLYAECGPVGLVVYVQDGEEINLTKETVEIAVARGSDLSCMCRTAKKLTGWSLTKETVEIAARSRLRAARLYAAPLTHAAGLLQISALIGPKDNHAFTYRVWFEKQKLDLMVGIRDWSSTGWSEWHFGTHGGNANFVLASITRNLDEFIDDYLRVNKDDCDRSNARLGRVVIDPFGEE